MLNIHSEEIKDSVFRLGEVISVDGRTVKVIVDKAKNTSHFIYQGELLKNVSVGSYIKIIKGFTRVVGQIEGESVKENSIFTEKDYVSQQEKISRVIQIKFLGFFDEKGDFRNGIKELPLVGNEAYLLDKGEFRKVLKFVKTNDVPLSIGCLANDSEQIMQVGVDKLFASHIGIFGNTGGGKSYTLAKIYSELLKHYQSSDAFRDNANFLLIDFNGEYASENAITSSKTVIDLSTRSISNRPQNKLPFSEFDLIDVELISILANATDKTQKPFISRCIRFYNKVSSSDRPINFFRSTLQNRIRDLFSLSDKSKAFQLRDYLEHVLTEGSDFYSVEELASHLTRDQPLLNVQGVDWQNTNRHFYPSPEPEGYTRHLKDAEIEKTALYICAGSYDFPLNAIGKLIHFMYQQLVFDVFTNKAQNEHIAPAINKLKSRVDDIGKVIDFDSGTRELFSEHNFVVVNLKSVNLEMRKTLPLLLAKKTYTEHRHSHSRDNAKYLSLIIDEAHNVLSKDSLREAETWKDYRVETFEEIIKEGRKFGVFLTLASQRPSDISPTIISQLHNYFLHRLVNNNDIAAVEKTISYLDKLSVESLPILPTGTCILTGLFTELPVVVDIGEIGKGMEPSSETISLTRNWR